jgi:hypothetical protein
LLRRRDALTPDDRYPPDRKTKTLRNKVYGGGLSNTAQRLVKETLGDLPERVLKRPPYVAGIQFHALGEEPITLEHGVLLCEETILIPC